MNEKIYEKAIKLLAGRLHTTGELLQKLKLRNFQKADILPVLRQLEAEGFLDDERFAQIFVENLKLYKDFGYYGIKAKLLKKQIPHEIAEGVLAEFYTLEDEFRVAGRLTHKLKRQGRNKKEQILRSLQSRGFRSEIIYKIMPND